MTESTQGARGRRGKGSAAGWVRNTEWERVFSRSMLVAVALHGAVLYPDDLVRMEIPIWRQEPAFEMLVSTLIPVPAKASRGRPARAEVAPRPTPAPPELRIDPSTLEVPPPPRFESGIRVDLPPPPVRAEPDEWAGYEALSAVVKQPEIRNRGEVERFLHRRYDRIVRRTGATGVVMLIVWIDEEGMARRMMLDGSSGNKQLDELALSVQPVIRFEPALRLGEPIRVVVKVPFRFRSIERGNWVGL